MSSQKFRAETRPCNFRCATGNYNPMRPFPRHAFACMKVLAALWALGPFVFAWALPAADPAFPQSVSAPTSAAPGSSPQAWFAKGQAALKDGDLDTAETAFRKVISLDPRSGAAYSNLGVIAMRRKQWNRALGFLRNAETLEPKMTGIRLNIGLVEYRQGNYAAAIAPLASVVRDEPRSQQARYLLGMCQVFTKHYEEGIKVLETLWPERSSDVLYLYLMDIAAVESGQKELDEKILKQMITVGEETAEFHLILGKAHLK